ncbi:DoxX family membrane protein [Aliarcobacter butzleri]|uniref:DoxX family membrane protein n=1 Tax=Aliarcobacter butzleri TaxID=28197 RepID=A0AAW6VCC5_9BACT|nr:DoxX family membrane protein [Aliarcobacter butzleri]MBF7071531.1 DoxX family membrane protein [Aliarcobacter butzleri]MCG3663950.1 DoxX family membrane protein [Aliarcobacter butzleri]MCG3679685.1 DoxX family membrane protein [Aliarcobacter butzleri]MCG3681980.1 DoxX family membrane protein [Aliarcobacter butzleri]MCG3711860.1 DoxX family membrane protein [Aliarcobacter butzleri]
MQNTIKLMRLSLGIIFVWYGMLKFFPTLSPAEDLAIKTIDIMFFHLIDGSLSIKLLAILEVAIGIGFLSGYYTKLVTIIFLGHMLCTFAPLFILPELSFTHAPYAFTLVGQYIVKNIVFILVGVMIYQNETKRAYK